MFFMILTLSLLRITLKTPNMHPNNDNNNNNNNNNNRAVDAGLSQRQTEFKYGMD